MYVHKRYRKYFQAWERRKTSHILPCVYTHTHTRIHIFFIVYTFTEPYIRISIQRCPKQWSSRKLSNIIIISGNNKTDNNHTKKKWNENKSEITFVVCYGRCFCTTSFFFFFFSQENNAFVYVSTFLVQLRKKFCQIWANRSPLHLARVFFLSLCNLFFSFSRSSSSIMFGFISNSFAVAVVVALTHFHFECIRAISYSLRPPLYFNICIWYFHIFNGKTNLWKMLNYKQCSSLEWRKPHWCEKPSSPELFTHAIFETFYQCLWNEWLFGRFDVAFERTTSKWKNQKNFEIRTQITVKFLGTYLYRCTFIGNFTSCKRS